MTTTLKGVDNPCDKMLASNITESFGEIKGVRNEIMVKASPPAMPLEEAPPSISKRDPSKLKGDINRALRNAGLSSVMM